MRGVLQILVVLLHGLLAGCGDAHQDNEADSVESLVSASTAASGRAMPYTADICSKVLERIGARLRTQPASMVVPAFPSEPRVRAYEAILKEEGYSLDATLRSRLLLQTQVATTCAHLADFSVPITDIDAALTSGLISEPTARLMRLWQAYDGFSLSPKTDALVSAVEACERAGTTPCPLARVCEHLPLEMHRKMAERPERDCNTLFSLAREDGEVAGGLRLQMYFDTAHRSENRFLQREGGRPFDNRKLTDPGAAIAVDTDELAAFRDAQAFVATLRAEAASPTP
jgi:hypothetical protein